jgi:hypothetical protein
MFAAKSSNMSLKIRWPLTRKTAGNAADPGQNRPNRGGKSRPAVAILHAPLALQILVNGG